MADQKLRLNPVTLNGRIVGYSGSLSTETLVSEHVDAFSNCQVGSLQIFDVSYRKWWFVNEHIRMEGRVTACNSTVDEDGWHQQSLTLSGNGQAVVWLEFVPWTALKSLWKRMWR